MHIDLKISCLKMAMEGATKNEVIFLRSLALVFPSKAISWSGNVFWPHCPLTDGGQAHHRYEYI